MGCGMGCGMGVAWVWHGVAWGFTANTTTMRSCCQASVCDCAAGLVGAFSVVIVVVCLLACLLACLLSRLLPRLLACTVAC